MGHGANPWRLVDRDNLENNPYKVTIASGDWACTIAIWKDQDDRSWKAPDGKVQPPRTSGLSGSLGCLPPGGSFTISLLEVTDRERPALQILLCCLQQFVTLALASAPFGIPATAFWIYVSGSLLFIIGLIKILKELPQKHGVDKIMPFGRLFFAIPLAVFGSEHLTATANIAKLVPRWIPAHTFWVYLVGLAFLCAALSIAVLVQARLAAALVGMTLLTFVFTMDVPAVVANPRNRFFWALALRQLAFSGGAFAFAMSPWSNRPKRPSPAQPIAARAVFPRFFVGFPSLFYGVEHLLHPEYVPCERRLRSASF